MGACGSSKMVERPFEVRGSLYFLDLLQQPLSTTLSERLRSFLTHFLLFCCISCPIISMLGLLLKSYPFSVF
jgi:hypothetical protein